MRRKTIIFICLLAMIALSGRTAPGPPLEATDFGEGVFAAEPEFDFSQEQAAHGSLLRILDESPDPAKHFRAIRAYHKRFSASSDSVPRLRELVIALRSRKTVRAEVDTALIIGYLVVDDSKEARPQHLKDLAPIVASIRQNRANDAWARLTTAMLFSFLPELKGNWFDESLYAMSCGYYDPQLQLAVGSFLLCMDLAYGGNERMQWLVYLAFTRAQALAPGNERLTRRIRNTIGENMGIPGYRPSKWLKMLVTG